ncbi:MAG TPA: D-tyrosyl-tRNA(Tyr) deacylase [Bacteroidetes bacterium]|nr:MAG: D-tyrosyl-tRNA(Tyr) deacylase [Ignavibacteria bacterium GWA2_54_16]HCA81387.1 D-tyrosyl-tRNA(Tyr) deacylase [Bacteroidota bacterium]
MRALIQRVKRSSVTIDGKLHSAIGPGLLILLGVKVTDGEPDADYLADRCAALRIFDDSEGKMNLSIRDTGGSVLVVSQFTLYGDTRRGNRPSYSDAAGPELAENLYERFVKRLSIALGQEKIATGVFRAMMDVELVNDGPVTVTVESKAPS